MVWGKVCLGYVSTFLALLCFDFYVDEKILPKQSRSSGSPWAWLIFKGCPDLMSVSWWWTKRLWPHVQHKAVCSKEVAERAMW